ncbi:MAG: hypothetical protein RI949_1666 [Pseudomonadota bacterium]
MNMPTGAAAASKASAARIEAQDLALLEHLRHHRRGHRRSGRAPRHLPDQPPSLGEQIADRVAAVVGSWRFIVIQSALIVGWISWNLSQGGSGWDPYPFILLNLVLSFQAAYTAPAIMMSQNRQAQIDRLHAANDYEVNVKAELEIELLHEKIDLLREQEIKALTDLVDRLVRRLEPTPPAAQETSS